jgi:glycosyltransferase involved in cell wall biosynthesis
MPRAVVLSGHDLAEWRARHARGDAPAALPYEVDALGSAGFDLTVKGISGGPLVTKARHVVEHRTGVSVQVPMRAVPAVARADVVIALLEGEGVLPGLMKRRHLPPYSRVPLVVWSCWLADDISRADPERRRLLRRRIEAVDLITHLSRHEKQAFVDLGIPEERLFAVTYGVSHRYYLPGDDEERDLPVLAVGQDRGRDYATLFDGVRGTGLVVDVVCKPENIRGLDVPDNVRLHAPVSHRAYRDLLRRARIMAVPTTVMAYPTGSSVALEAASSGCCVVATDTPAMADYFRHGETGVLVPPGDPTGWRDALLALVDDPERRQRLGAAARRSVETTFNAEHMWHELAGVMRERGLV